jgi:hypothetical protein
MGATWNVPRTITFVCLLLVITVNIIEMVLF